MSAEETRHTNEEATRRRGPWPGTGSYDLEKQAKYLQDVKKFPILTREEELKYTKQFALAREAIQKLLRGIPELILHQLRHFDEIKNDIRISNYIELENDMDDADIRATMDKVLVEVNKLETGAGKAGKNFASRLWEILNVLSFRDSFYDSCLKLISEEETRKKFISEDAWKKMSDELVDVCKKREEARKTLVECNLRLVVSIAKKYTYCNYSFQDLIQEGNLGLMHAVEKFDYTRGHHLSTYASYWIRQTITRALTNCSRTIRISASILKQINDIRAAERELLEATGEEPTPEAIADKLWMPHAQVRALIKMAQQPVSLQTALSEDADLADLIPDENAPAPEVLASLMTLRTSIGKALNNLNERERMVITRRFGLNGENPLTLTELSREMGLSSERVHQIEANAIRKLRLPESRQFFDGYGP